MKKIVSTLCCAGLLSLLPALSAVEPQAWYLGQKSTWKTTNKPQLRHDFGALAKLTDNGLSFYEDTRDHRIYLNKLDIDPKAAPVMEIWHRGQTVLFGVFLYGANESGFSADRRASSSLPVNQRYYNNRLVVNLAEIPRWNKGGVKEIVLAVSNSGEGSGAEIYSMALRRGHDRLQNGSLVYQDANGLPVFWDFTGNAEMNFSDAFQLPVCKVNGGESSTILDSLVPDHKYSVSVYAAGNVNIKAVIYDQENNVIAEHKLKKSKKRSGNMDLYRANYVVPENAHHGKLVISGDNAYQFADALLENNGGKAQWRAEWIWSPEGTRNDQRCYFRKEFVIDDPEQVKSVFIQATCDDAFTLEINNNRIFNNNIWSNPQHADLKKYLQKGKNVITASGYNGGSAAGFLCEIKVEYLDSSRKPMIIATDSDWLCRLTNPGDNWRRVNPPEATRTGWKKARSLGRPPVGPWGTNIKYQENMPEKADVQPLDKSYYAGKKTKAVINTDLAHPRMEINGEIAEPMIYGIRWRGDRTRSYQIINESGFKVFRLGWEFSFESWQSDGSVNYKIIEDSITEFLQNVPDAKIILVMRISPPGWWQRKYLNEIVKFADGTSHGADGVFASPASEVYRREISAKLTEVIKRLENSWFASSIIGYMPCNLRGPEWVLTHKHNCFPDYSEPMLKYYRNYLKDKYGSNEALQKAWQNNSVTFETAQLPKQERRQEKDHYFLQGNRQDVVDYNRALQRANVDTIMCVMDAVKAGAPDKLRVLYFGYLMTLNHISYNSATSGHYDLSRLLQSGKVDVMVSPITYVWRHPGDISGIGTVEHSFHKNKVLWIQEADNRTYLTARDDHAVTFNAADSLNENWREFIYAMLKRESVWFYDLGGDWYANSYFPKQFREMRELYNQVTNTPITYQTPVAYFYDEQGLDSVSLGDWRWGQSRPMTLSADAQRMLAVCGIPYDMYELEDLYTLDLSKYKVLYFQNVWRKNPRLAKFLQEKVYPAGITCVWFYGAGYGQQGGVKGMQQLTGIKFELLKENTPLQYQTFDGRLIGFSGMKQAEVFAAQQPVDKVLAVYPGSQKPAVVIKNISNGKSVWFSTFDPTGELFRQVLIESGVTPMIDRADRVLFDGKYVGVFVLDAPGSRTVTLPGDAPAAVRDVLTGETIEVSGNGFVFEGKTGEARLFEIR